MSDRLIRISRDKADLVIKLVEEPTTPFETYADVVVFAASLGYSRNKLIPLTANAQRPEIRLSTFSGRGYDTAINLLAISHTNDQNILGSDEESNSNKIRIFEEYANGGFEIIQDRVRGSIDYLDTILLLLASEKNNSQKDDREFDLTDFF